MSSAVLRIQVATLSDVPDGQSRIDGVPNQVVTLRSTGTGGSHLIRFFDVTNPGISGATSTDPNVPALTPVGDGRSYTFTPGGGSSGWGQSFGIELIVDQGLTTEVRSRRKYAIPTENLGVILPLFAEGADPQASLNNAGTLQIQKSVDNADDNWRGYHPRLLDWLIAQDKYVGTINLVPYPSSGTGTTPVHVGTVYLNAGSLVSLGTDLGDLADAGIETTIEIYSQNPPVLLVSESVTQLKAWVDFAQSPVVSIPASGPFEIYINSEDAAGVWACNGIRLSTR